MHLVEKIPRLSDLAEVTFCINCYDQLTNSTGFFAYDEWLYFHGVGHFSISPVFGNIDDLYVWCKLQGFKYHKSGCMLTMCRTMCRGVG